MKARFIGTSSCGFIKNRVYDLYSSIRDVLVNGEFIYCICLHDKNSDAECLYTNIDAVLLNWRIEKEHDIPEITSLWLEDIKNQQEAYNKISNHNVLMLPPMELLQRCTLADSIIRSQQRVIESLLNNDEEGIYYDSK